MKILIITKNWLGDILFEIPAIEMLRANFPDAEIICLTHPRCREILEQVPAVSRVITVDEKKSSIFEKLSLVFRLRREKIDTAYFFHRSRTRAFMTMLAGIKNRVGYGIKKNHFLTRAFAEPAAPLHHVDYFVQLLALNGLRAVQNPYYTFYYSSEDDQSALQLLKEHGLSDFVCFHLGANWEPKRWPAERFAELAEKIYRKWNLTVVLTGGENDKSLGEEVFSKIREARVISLIGCTRLGELAAVFSRALFVVSGDSGPMHIASGAGARVIALFGPTDPFLTGPRGAGEKIILSFVPPGYQAPWYGKEFPKEGWLSQISAQDVMSALEKNNWSVKTLGEKPVRPLVSNVKKTGRPQVLFNTLSNIGDVILSTPVLMSLVKQYPGCRATVIVGPRAKGILEGSAFIDELVIYDKHASLAEKVHFVRKLRRKKYEAAVDLKNSAIPFLVSAKKRSRLFRSFKSESARARHLEVLEQIGLSVSAPPVFDFYGAAEKKSAAEKLSALGDFSRGYIVIAPAAASEVKTWPAESFGKLIEMFLSSTEFSVVLAGGPREEALAEPLTSIDPNRVFNLAGRTTLREFAALVAGSELLVANDSSSAQLGFEMNHPSAVIFGPTDPKKFARYDGPFKILRVEGLPCSPCGQAQCHLERQACLLDLQPEAVWNACRELLEKGRVKMIYEAGRRYL